MAQSVIVLRPGHFFQLTNDLLDVYGPKIGAIGVAVYNVLARHADHTTGECWPSIPRIARTLALCQATVKKYLHRLAIVGLITITPRRDEAGDPTSNLYTLCDPASPARSG